MVFPFAEVGPNFLGQLVRGGVWSIRDGLQHGQPLGGHLKAMLTQDVGRWRWHRTGQRSRILDSVNNQIKSAVCAGFHRIAANTP
jgi:hypothetical protein